LTHFTSAEFWEFFQDLPDDVQQRARRSFELLKLNPRHPSPRLKKIGVHWLVRVGRGYRALGATVDGSMLWVWIGTHADYEKPLP